MNLKSSLYAISGIGPSFAKRLEYLNIFTVEDLIYHFPFRYEDYSNQTNVLESKEGEKITLQGEIWSITNVFTRSRKVLTKAIFNDGSSPIELTWFNQSWLTKQIQTGDKLQISGKVSKYKNRYSIIAPVWEKLTNSEFRMQNEELKDKKILNSELITLNSLHTGRLVPVYPETAGLTSKWLRTKIARILSVVKHQLEDPLPEDIKDQMLPLPEAISKIHFPQSYKDIEEAKQRLGFDELFLIQLATLKTRLEWKEKPSVKEFRIQNEELRIFRKNLPFRLTKAQEKVINEILDDLKKTQPMNRLVQGEVGSGKTIVAAIIAYITYLNGFKTYYMAPTEILAFQHYDTLSMLLEPYGITVGIYTGSRKFTKNSELKDKKTLNSELKTLNSLPDIIIGTHALLSEKLDIPNVGLVIVDEQQRFGVEQRSLLRSKAKVPHFLTMTATPIPRTVALTLYGDLDLSVIDELPKGRIPVRTHVVPSKKRADAYEFIRKKVKSGDQVYIITPLIEQSETLVTVKAAKVEFERLSKEVFPDLKLGLLHGRLKSKEKEQVLNHFKDLKIQILVSTSVVEVGVDITNATIMVIEGAERFGLAQLHQLRGRVGRGEKESFCLLFPGQEDSQTVSRLKHLEKTYDGLKLAELDLKIRGSGELFGTRQSGRFELKIASFNDLTLIEKTRDAAKRILARDSKLERYSLLKQKLYKVASNAMPD